MRKLIAIALAAIPVAVVAQSATTTWSEATITRETCVYPLRDGGMRLEVRGGIQSTDGEDHKRAEVTFYPTTAGQRTQLDAVDKGGLRLLQRAFKTRPDAGF